MAFRIIQPNYISGGGGASTLLTGLVSWWSLESDGTDSHGANTLSALNTPTHSTGQVSNAGYFARASSQAYTITDGTQSGLDITGSISVAAWVYATSAPNDVLGVATKYYATTGERSWALLLDFRSGISRVNAILSTNGTSFEEFVGSSDTISLNTWHCVVMTWDSSTQAIKVYVDGTTAGNVDTTSTLSSIYNGGSQFCIGCRRRDSGTSSNHFDGMIDEVAVWNKALSASEVAEYYNSGTGISYASL